MRASHEAYQKKIKLVYRGIGIVLLAFMLSTLAVTIGSDFTDFIHVDVLQKVIASKTEMFGGFMTLVWHIAHGLPYVIAMGRFIYLYGWTKKRFEVFL